MLEAPYSARRGARWPSSEQEIQGFLTDRWPLVATHGSLARAAGGKIAANCQTTTPRSGVSRWLLIVGSGNYAWRFAARRPTSENAHGENRPVARWRYGAAVLPRCRSTAYVRD